MVGVGPGIMDVSMGGMRGFAGGGTGGVILWCYKELFMR